jgi:DNA-binding NarL/FixJ family response regulator
MKRIVIADDHSVVREGVKRIVSDMSDAQVAGEAATGKQVLDLVGGNSFDLLILDIALPDMSGVNVLSRVRELRPEIPVLVLSMHPEDEYGERMLKAGAAGYVCKESIPEELQDALHKVLEGEKYISQSLANKLATDYVGGRETLPHEKLSPRELQVMMLIAQGRTVRQIAEDLDLSVNTVGTYRARLLEKTGLRNNAEITYYALKHHLIE